MSQTFACGRQIGLYIYTIPQMDMVLQYIISTNERVNTVGVKIIGAGKYLPPFTATNEDFSKIVETSDEWIVQRTGISLRHLTTGDATYQMGVKAAKQAMDRAGVTPQEIDLVIGTTVSGDFTTPSMACMAACDLGITGAPCFDINAACAGFVYALDAAEMHLASGRAKCALIISSEMLSRITDYTDRSSCVIFADGAGACVVKASDKMYQSCITSEPEGAHRIFAHSAPLNNPFTGTTKFDGQDEMFGHGNGQYIYMEGREVYKFATRSMPHAVQTACKKAGITVDDLDLIIPHQANIRIVQTAAKNMGISMDKCYVNIDRYGNTSSACIPIGIAECMETGRLKPGSKVCLVGFGAGLVYAASVFEWEN